MLTELAPETLEEKAEVEGNWVTGTIKGVVEEGAGQSVEESFTGKMPNVVVEEVRYRGGGGGGTWENQRGVGGSFLCGKCRSWSP